MSNRVQRKTIITKLTYTLQGIYDYNVCLLTSVDYGETWWYAGVGKYCRTIQEAEAYAKELLEKVEKSDREAAGNVAV